MSPSGPLASLVCSAMVALLVAGCEPLTVDPVPDLSVAGGDLPRGTDLAAPVAHDDLGPAADQAPARTCDGGTAAGYPAECGDRIRNAGETDVDCGGLRCQRCRGGRGCLANDDCASSVCAGGKCTTELGYFAPRVFPAGKSGVAMAVADFDADGLTDVAVANYDGDDVGLLRSRPGGILLPPKSLPVGHQPRVIAAGDFDGDGQPDLAVGNEGSADGSLLFGKGGGVFAPAVRLALPAAPVAVAAGDFDGDRRADVVFASRNGRQGGIMLRLNRGGGLFATASLSVPTDVFTLATADLNGDGRSDLVVSGDDEPVLLVLIAQGGGGFLGPVTLRLCGGDPECARAALATGDVNLDGKSDLAAAAGQLTARAHLFRGRGDGNFNAPDIYPLPGGACGGVRFQVTRTSLNSIALGDLDLDGRPDVALSCGPRVGVLRQTAQGSFESPLSFSVAPQVQQVAFLKRKGGAELAALDLLNQGVSVLQREGGGHLRAAEPLGPGTDLVAADLDGDGRLDLASALDSSIGLLLTRPCGLRPANPVSLPLDVGQHFVLALAAGDLNRDGRIDLVAGSHGVGPDAMGSISVLFALGGGGFAPPQHLENGRNSFASVALADLDQDGRLDIAAVRQRVGYYDVVVLLNDGKGGFLPPRTFAVLREPSAIAAGDLDRDGRQDLVAADRGDRTVNVLQNRGAGTFGLLASYSVDESPGSILIVDLNRDQRLDVAVGSALGGSVDVLLGQGGGKLAPGKRLLVARGFFLGWRIVQGRLSMATADLDGDGWLDLVTALDRSNLGLFHGNGDGTFRPLAVYGVSTPSGIAIGDFDGDARQDIVTAAFGGVSLLRDISR